MSIARGFLFVVCAVAVGLPLAAHGQTTVEESIAQEAGAALRTDSVYVHPDAGLDERDAAELRERIVAADAGPIYIAVLPEEAALEAGGDADQLLVMIGEAVGRRGTYAVLVGDELRAGATDGTPFAEGTVPAVADDAVRTGGDGAAVLFAFVDGLRDAAADGSADDGFNPAPLLVVAGGVGAFVFLRRRRRAREDRRQLGEVRGAAMDDLVALGDDLRALDLDVEMPGADPRAKEE